MKRTMSWTQVIGRKVMAVSLIAGTAVGVATMGGCQFEREGIREYDRDTGKLIKETDKCKGTLENPISRPSNLGPSGLVPVNHPNLCIERAPDGTLYLGCVPGYPGKVFPIRDWDCTVVMAEVPVVDELQAMIAASSETGPFSVTLYDNPTPLWSVTNPAPFGITYSPADDLEVVTSRSLPRLLSALYEKGFRQFGSAEAGGPWGFVEDADFTSTSDPMATYIPGMRYFTGSEDTVGTWVPIVSSTLFVESTNRSASGPASPQSVRPR